MDVGEVTDELAALLFSQGMLPIHRDANRAFADKVKPMCECILALVDSHHHEPLTPAVHSKAMADLAEETSLIRDDGWGDELVKNVALWATIQINGLIEGSAGVVELLGSERGFVLSPYALLRFAAECAGRARWLLEPQISTRDRVIRSLNLRIDDFWYRKRLLGDEVREDMNQRMRGIREAATARGLSLTPRRRGGPQLIEPGLSTNTEFAKRGMSGSYGRTLSRLASSATHGALTAVLDHIIEVPSDSALLEEYALVGSSSHQANILLLVVGNALRDAIRAQYEYYGYESQEWSEAVDRLMTTGRRVLEEISQLPSS